MKHMVCSADQCWSSFCTCDGQLVPVVTVTADMGKQREMELIMQHGQKTKVWNQIDFWKILIRFILQGCMNLIKSNSKDIYNVPNDVCFKWMWFLWTLNASKNPDFFLNNSFHKKYLPVFNIIITGNVSWAANQHIRMISEGSCDTKGWSNDAENSTLHHRNKLHFKIYSNRKQIF